MSYASPDPSDILSGRQKRGRFGTVSGVFLPTLLTILGVIMYLRVGWVVGRAGLLGSLLIISLAFAITTATGLSLSSVTTNLRIGAGGAYSVISQSLGLEMGGSVGVPLYLSQVLATAMYIFGFREGWIWAMGEWGFAESLWAEPAVVDLALFAVIFGAAYWGANIALRLQYGVAVIIAGSLVSIVVAAAQGSMQFEPALWAARVDQTGALMLVSEDFWVAFALFFPAATGIMAGANLSGELRAPSKSIPRGTMAAIAVSYVIYVALSYWLARSATPVELRENYTIMIERAAWGPAVVGGLLGATFSSALASMVGAPRILKALAAHGIVPRGESLAHTTAGGEPRRAMLATGGLVLAALLLRDLNVVAPFITMFFLITYGVINIVVLIEQSLGLASFRPQLRVPRAVPLVGAIGCTFAMFIINPAVSLIALAVVLGFYGLLIRRHLPSPFADVRSGLFLAVAEWAAQKSAALPPQKQRAWKPNLLVPVVDALALRSQHQFLRDLVRPTGYLDLMGVVPPEQSDAMEGALEAFAREMRREDVFARWAVLRAEDHAGAIILGMEALKASFFRPNIVFMEVPEGRDEWPGVRRVLDHAQANGLGVAMLGAHPHARLGARQVINLWVHDEAPDMELVLRRSHLNLAILLAYTISRNWGARVRLVSVVEADHEAVQVRESLENLVELTRIAGAEIHLFDGDFRAIFARAPRCDLNIMGLSQPPDLDLMQRAVQQTEASVLFVADSGEESALA